MPQQSNKQGSENRAEPFGVNGSAQADEAVVQLGSLHLSAADLYRGCSWGFCLAFIWLIFGYGFADDISGTKGYLVSGVLFAKIGVFVLAIVLASSKRLFDTATQNLWVLVVSGVICVFTAVPLAATVQLEGWGNLLVACTVVSSVAASVCCLASARALFSCSEPLHLVVDMHIGLIVLCFSCMVVTLLNGLVAAIVFGLLPGVSAVFSYAAFKSAKLPDASLKFGKVVVPHMGLNANARENFVRLSIVLFVFCVDIALVRSMGLGFSGERAGHSIGALLATAILALLAVGVIAWASRRPQVRVMHIYYACSCMVICFASLVLLLTSQNNLVVRTVEGVAYFLLVMALMFELAVVSRACSVPERFSLCISLAIASVGIALGWILQNATFQPGNSDSYTIVQLAATAAAFIALLCVFPTKRYDSFANEALHISEAGNLQMGVSTAGTVATAVPAEGEAAAGAEVPALTQDDAVAVAKVAFVKELQSRQNFSLQNGAKDEASSKVQGRRITFKEAALQLANESALSKREHEVLLLLIKGYPDQRIADEMYVSYNTVRAHIRHIYTKTGAHNREELLDMIGAYQKERAEKV